MSCEVGDDGGIRGYRVMARRKVRMLILSKS